MLLRFKVKNFLSFYEETVFDMFPNIEHNNLLHHIHSNTEVPLLKQTAILGANGAGKSNFIKAVLFLRNFVLHFDSLNKIDINDYIFQLTDKKSQTIFFEIEFFHKSKYYLYNVKISSKKIYEKLSLSGLGKQKDILIFERDGLKIKSDYFEKNNTNTIKALLEKNYYTSLLILNQKFPVIISNEMSDAFHWFDNNVSLILTKSTLPRLISLMSNNKAILDFANNFVNKIDVGTNMLRVTNTSFDKWISKTKNATEIQQIIEENPQNDNANLSQIINDRNTLNISIQKGRKIVQKLMFNQIGLSGYHKDMDITTQSDGTARLLTLIPAFYSAIYEGKTIFIDEIDNSIHTNLMIHLLQFYADNQSKGQLIFTTHTTKLLNQVELFRQDEIWLTEKINGSTKMYSLNDYILKNTQNIENGYLAGRYGGIPVLERIDI